MKKVIVILFTILAVSCTGKLSDEDRKALKEEMEDREVRQIRDDEIVNRALEMGREFRKADNPNAKISMITYTTRPNEELRGQLWDAYEEAEKAGQTLEDNIQRDYPDNLLYTYVENDSVFSMVVITIPKSAVVGSL